VSGLDRAILRQLKSSAGQHGKDGWLHEPYLEDFEALGVSGEIVRARLPALVDEGLLEFRPSRPHLTINLGEKQFEVPSNRAWRLTDMGADLAFSDMEAAGSEPNSIAVPASDRFVALNHNSPEYREGIEAIGRLSEAVRTTNSALFADESQRLAVVREIEGIKELLNGTSVRLAAIAQHVRDGSVLLWIAGAAGAGVVGNSAYAAVEALRRLCGF
jgi:hypothetical protein